jgi:hypothetical protein
MKHALKTASTLAMATTILSGCVVDLDIDADDCDDRHGIDGSGHVVTESRTTGPFWAVSVSGVGRVIIEQADHEFLEIRAEDNVLSYLDSDVRGGTLFLGPRSGVNFGNIREIEYLVGVRDLEEISLSGAVYGEAPHVSTEYLRAVLSGATRLDVDGWAEEQDVTVSGVGSYRGRGLESLGATVVTSGTSSATVWVREYLDARASGVSSIRFAGDPDDLRTEVSGLATIRPL